MINKLNYKNVIMKKFNDEYPIINLYVNGIVRILIKKG